MGWPLPVVQVTWYQSFDLVSEYGLRGSMDLPLSPLKLNSLSDAIWRN